jgi:hypothetical protein
MSILPLRKPLKLSIKALLKLKHNFMVLDLLYLLLLSLSLTSAFTHIIISVLKMSKVQCLCPGWNLSR